VTSSLDSQLQDSTGGSWHPVATFTTTDSAGPSLSIQQVTEALNPDVHLDFPRVTDICEAASRDPAGADAAASVLVATLGEQDTKAGDSRNIAQDYLKVLTILHEMVYDNRLVELLKAMPGLKPALERLRHFREGSRGDPNYEVIRMLANETRKSIFSAPEPTYQRCDSGDFAVMTVVI
jgi:hypothetical protein